MGKFYYRETFQQIVTTQQGLQAVSNLKNQFTLQQLLGETTSNLRTQRDSWATNPFDLNPYSVPPSNNLYTNTTSLLASNDAYYIDNYRFKLKMLSMVNIAQKVTVYVVVNKQSSDQDAVNSWAQFVNTFDCSSPNFATKLPSNNRLSMTVNFFDNFPGPSKTTFNTH